MLFILNLSRIVPEGKQLVDFTDFGSTLGTDSMGIFLQSGMLLIDEFLGSIVPDPDSVDGYDLGVNRLLRSTIVDEDGAFTIKVTDLPDYAATSGIIFQGHDMLTETSITLDEVKLYGLDSFEHFDPLNAAGKYTLGNTFSWENLKAEFVLSLVMKPSTKSDSLVVVGSSHEVRESITVSMAIHDINVDFYYLFGIDQNELGKVQLGSLMDVSSMLPCLVLPMYSNMVTGLSATVMDMDPPTLSGFISSGIDRIISKAADAAYIMYEATLKRSMPNFFELTVRDIANQAISNLVDSVHNTMTCPRYEERPQDVDRILHFGDLLLPKDDAILIGGSGMEPYGTLARDIVSFLQTEVQAVNPLTNDLYINEGFLQSITSQSSGIPGTIGFPSDVFSFGSNFTVGQLIGSFELKLSDIQISNIHSFRLPLQILVPTSRSLLKNKVVVGSSGKPLSAASQLTFAFSDQGELESIWNGRYF